MFKAISNFFSRAFRSMLNAGVTVFDMLVTEPLSVLKKPIITTILQLGFMALSGSICLQTIATLFALNCVMAVVGALIAVFGYNMYLLYSTASTATA